MSRAGKIGLVLLLSLLLVSLAVSAVSLNKITKIKAIEVKPAQQLQQKITTNVNIKDYNSPSTGKGDADESGLKNLPQPRELQLNPKEPTWDISFSEIKELKEQTTSAQNCIDNELTFCSTCITRLQVTAKLTSSLMPAKKVIEICEAHGVNALRSTCIQPQMNYRLRVAGENSYFAWCDLKLKITSEPQITVVDATQGAIKVSWTTNLPASEKLIIYEQTNGQEIAATQEKNNNAKRHEVTYTGLNYGTYLIRAESKTSALWPVPAQEVQSNQISFQLLATPVELTYIDPTPQNNAQLTSDQFTVTISGNRAINRATLRLINRDGSVTTHAMQGNGAVFSKTLNSRAGQISYYVEATAVDGRTGRTVTRIALVPFPRVYFTYPTPNNDEVLIDPGTVTIAVNANEPLLNAALELTNLDTNAVTTSQMQRQNAQVYSYTLPNLPLGRYSPRVIGTDDEGDAAETDERSFTIAHVVSTPQLTFVSPTLENGAETSARSTTVKISSSEPLASATLQWRKPNGETASYQMARITSTEYTYTINSLVEGNYAYSVNAVDVQGDASSTLERTLTVRFTPPQLTFTLPTPVNGATLSSDEATIRVSSSEPLASAALSLTNAVETKLVQMNLVSPTEFQVQLRDLVNGTNSFRVSAIDVDGDSGVSETRTFTTPIAVQLHEFQGEGIGSMAVYDVNGVSTLFVGTFNETTPGKSHVYKSTDGINWIPVFTAAQSNWVDGVTTTVTGVYSMAVYNNELYIGTGSSIAGTIDGDIYKTNDGLNWNRAYHNDNQQINRLTVIDNTLYAGTKTSTGTGNIMWYNQTDNWRRKSCEFEVKAMEKFQNNIYYSCGLGIYQFIDTNQILDLRTLNPGGWAPDNAAMKTFNNKLYLGNRADNEKVIAETTNLNNWQTETISDTFSIVELFQLTDGSLYMPSGKLDRAKLFRKSTQGTTELVANLAPYDVIYDVVEFKGKKYISAVDIKGEQTNRWGYIFKLTS